MENRGDGSAAGHHHQHITLHEANLRTLEVRAEEYVLAFIKETNPLRYLVNLLKSWFEPIYHGVPTNTPSLDVSSDAARHQMKMNWGTVLSIFFLKMLLLLAKPFELLGAAIENTLNVVYTNGGLRQALWKSLFDNDGFKRPHLEDDDYYSFSGLMDRRYKLPLDSKSFTNAAESTREAAESTRTMAEVCMMASKLSYENKRVVERVVKKEWKMNFVKFFDCWNEYLESNTTQAYIFTDKPYDTNVIILAFRGTQPFNMYDWCTDFDFSYYVLPEMGRVHVGFLEALGLGSRLNKDTFKNTKLNAVKKARGQSPSATPSSGLSPEVLNDDRKVLAYDAICAKIRVLLRQNLGASLYITGHSLGGALAALFAGLLLFENDDILLSLKGVFTFGQPRVGDASFAQYMQKKLCVPRQPRKYFRVVFRTDIVARIPFDDHVLQFKHIPPCHYYYSYSESKVLHEEPYKSLLSIMLLPAPHINAVKELWTSLYGTFWRRVSGDSDEDQENLLCLVVRFVALLIPGICAHLPSYYLDAVRRAPPCFHLQADVQQKGMSHEHMFLTSWVSLLANIFHSMWSTCISLAFRVLFKQGHGHNQ